ncbi:MAG: alkaline phytoceramidase [Pseudomonadota bacterium]
MTGGDGRLVQDWRSWLMIGLTAALAVAALVVPAMPQPQSYHAFADCRSFWAVPNFFNVVSNLPFLAGGALGLHLIWKGGGQFVDPREQLPYLVFFLGALLTCFGSAYYHAAPDNPRLVWDRLPMTLGFSGLVAASLVERVDLKVGLGSLWPLLALGVITVLYWYGTERAHAGNIIPYAAYQGWSIVVIIMLLLLYPARRYSHGRLLAWAAGWYGIAKVFETFDLRVFRLLGGTLSGHTIKHVLAAFAVFAVVRQLRLREPVRIPAQ